VLIHERIFGTDDENSCTLFLHEVTPKFVGFSGKLSPAYTLSAAISAFFKPALNFLHGCALFVVRNKT
jgi:hypothetical protein